MGILRPVASATLLVVLASIACAQESPAKVQIFGGYSLLHKDAGGLTALNLDAFLHASTTAFAVKSNFNGWNAEGQYNVNNWLGLVADVGGHQGTAITASRGVSGVPGGSEYYFLGGPSLSFHNKTRLTPFVHGLFGWERVSMNAGTIRGLTPPVSTVATTAADFTMAVGAGLDYKLTRRFSLRLAQGDWFHTSLNLNKFYGRVFGPSVSQEFLSTKLSTNQRNLRFSTGLVVRF